MKVVSLCRPLMCTATPDNPILTPADVPPHREDYEVIGVFNAGVAEVRDEVLLVLRVAERAYAPRPDIGRAGTDPYDANLHQIQPVLRFRPDELNCGATVPHSPD